MSNKDVKVGGLGIGMRCKTCHQEFEPVKMERCAVTYGLDEGVVVDYCGKCSFCGEIQKCSRVIKV
jgi:hypothetical protein